MKFIKRDFQITRGWLKLNETVFDAILIFQSNSRIKKLPVNKPRKPYNAPYNFSILYFLIHLELIIINLLLITIELLFESTEFNPFSTNGPFLYSLKTSDVFRGYRSFQGVQKLDIG